MAISAKDVMSLRQRTGLGMMQCKQALSETNGDFDAAIELLRKKLKGKMDERSDRQSSEGAIAVARSTGALALIELTCETDFVALNDRFVETAARIAELALQSDDGEVAADDAISALVDELRITTQENVTYRRGTKVSGEPLGSYVHHNRKIGVVVQGEGELSSDLLTGICQHIAAAVPTPMSVEESSLPSEELQKQKKIALEEANAAGKPPEIAQKIAAGKLRKWVDEHTLMGQIYLREMESKKAVRDFLPKDGAIRSFVRYGLGG